MKSLDDIAVCISELTQKLGLAHDCARNLLRDSIEAIRAVDHKPGTDPLSEALWQVRYWTEQANQLRVLNDQKAEEILGWEQRYGDLSKQRQEELNRHHELEDALTAQVASLKEQRDKWMIDYGIECAKTTALESLCENIAGNAKNK